MDRFLHQDFTEHFGQTLYWQSLGWPSCMPSPLPGQQLHRDWQQGFTRSGPDRSSGSREAAAQ